MQTEEHLREQASRIGYVPATCSRCEGHDPRCANCGGSGRLWVDGPASLNDSGLERLLAIHEQLCSVGQPWVLQPRRLTAMLRPTHRPLRSAGAAF